MGAQEERLALERSKEEREKCVKKHGYVARCKGELRKFHLININLLIEKEGKITIKVRKIDGNGIPERRI